MSAATRSRSCVQHERALAMLDPRSQVLAWMSSGALPRERLDDALRAAGVTPSQSQWRVFVERLCAGMGGVMLAAAVGFFIAANWSVLGRFAKLGLVEAALPAAVGVALWRGLDSVAGRAALVTASILAGVLLALVGQVYQTGADTYELFAAWSLLVLPWTLAGRQPALWLLWIGLVDVAIVLYFRMSVARGFGALDLAFTSREALLWLAGFNAVALAAWEIAAVRLGGWLAQRWGPRVVGTSVGVVAVVLAMETIFAFPQGHVSSIVAFVAFVVAFYWAYRMRTRDLFMLSGLVLSLTLVLAALVGRLVWQGRDIGGSILVALTLIGCAAAGTAWLRRVGAEP